VRAAALVVNKICCFTISLRVAFGVCPGGHVTRYGSLMTRPALPAPPPAARRALDRLARIDPDLARIEREAGPLPWRTREPGFPGLLSAIVGQQISNQAAAAIWRRLCALEGCQSPEGLLAHSDETLRAAGLSRPKVGHARAVAEAFRAGILATESLAAMDDETAVATICSVRGLGPWSAEIYLLFALQRSDVFPAGDLALQAALAHLKSLPARPTARAVRELAVPWAPHRALAARLLWHWWRYVTGRPSMDDR
jgi:DNA-3-methyladenine glycosylase II